MATGPRGAVTGATLAGRSAPSGTGDGPGSPRPSPATPPAVIGYREEDVVRLETLANLRAVGLSLDDMRAYLGGAARGDAAASEQRKLSSAHARRLAREAAARSPSR